MEDLFKKFVNAGVGFLSQGNKRVQTTIDKLVQESKISEQEGKKIVDDLMKSSDTKLKELETQFKGLTETMMKNVGIGGKAVKASKSGASKPAGSGKAGSGSKAGGAGGAAKTASAAASKAAGTGKKAADSASKAASSASQPAAKSGAARKPAARKAAPAGQSDGQPADGPNE